MSLIQPKSRNRKPVNKDRFIPKMFLRGDSVVLGEYGAIFVLIKR